MGNLQLSPGSLFANRFEIQRAAGSGGMGTVYRASDRYSGDTVALKLLHADAGGHGEAERFAREAQLLSELRHPGIVSHVAHGQTPDGQRFLAMEWLEGQDLGQRLVRGPLPVRDCLRLLDQVADALSVAHQRGIIHRDLKPTNLFLVGGGVGQVKILDFGIARRIATSQAMTRTGMIIGTPEYMAPEQARGSRDLTAAADLFSLGCVLYECLTGQPPFVADHIAAVLVKVLFEEPIPVEDRRPGISEALSALLCRLLTKDAAQRVADATALGAELLNLGEMSEPALAVTMAGPPRKKESIAEQEQNLFSIVLAAPDHEEVGLGATQKGTDAQLGAADRQALLQGLARLGGSPEFLANGTLVVTVPLIGNAQDQATVAAHAALFIKERWPDAVVSMATGRGAVQGRTAVGEVVELAARSLTGDSHPPLGKPAIGVLIDPLSAKLLEGRFAQTPRPGGALLLHEERDVDASRPLLGKPTPCVGRDAELNALDGYLTACINEDEFQGVLLRAPPGSGKSRLRHEFLRRAEQRAPGLRILIGKGELLNAGAPYSIVASALRHFLGLTSNISDAAKQERILQIAVGEDVPTQEDSAIAPEFLAELVGLPFPEEHFPALRTARHEPKLMQLQLRRTFVAWLERECRRGPLLFALDDLHWGDALSVALFDHAMQEVAALPWFVLALARPEIDTIFPKLWHGRPVHELALKGLSRKACERLIQHTLGNKVSPALMARIVEQAAGNALFLEELIRAADEGTSEAMPQTVLAMLQARIGRLSLEARRTLRAASIFGHTCWSGGLAALLDTQPDDGRFRQSVQTLLDQELLEHHPESQFPDQTQYGFRHILMREAAYELLVAADRVALHRAAGLFLERQPRTEPRVIAEHFRRGAEPERAALWLGRAAQQAFESSDLSASLSYAEQALECGVSPQQRGELRALQAQAAFWSGDYRSCHTYEEEARPQLLSGSPLWYQVVTNALVACGRMSDASHQDELQQILLEAKPAPDAAIDQALSFLRCGQRWILDQRPDMQDKLLARALKIIEQERITAPSVLAQYHELQVLLISAYEDPSRCVQHLELAREAYEQSGATLSALNLATIEAGLKVRLGAGEDSIQFFRTHLARCHRLGSPQVRYLAQCSFATSLVRTEQSLPEARTLIEEAAKWQNAFGHSGAVQLQYWHAHLEYIEGNYAQALLELQPLIEKKELLQSALCVPMSLKALALHKLGHREEALRLSREAMAVLSNQPLMRFGGQEFQPRLVLLEILAEAGPREEALQVAKSTTDWLLRFVSKISNPAWRAQCLKLPCHARILELSAQLGGHAAFDAVNPPTP